MLANDDASVVPPPPTPMSASVPPSPAVYLPFGMSPRLGAPCAPSSYDVFGPPSADRAGDHDDDDDDVDENDDPSRASSTAPSPHCSTPGGGVYVSADEVRALQLWAEDREATHMRAAEAEQMATSRAAEAAQLRERLVASEDALRAVLRDRNRDAAPTASNRGGSAASTARSNRTDEEVGALAEALSARRRVNGMAKCKEEAAALRAEFQMLRSQRSARAPAPPTAGAVEEDAAETAGATPADA